MKKIVYKSIFSIVIVLFAFLMLPNKQVKAQEQGYPEVIMKTQYYMHYYEQENANTYEYLVQYVVEDIFINNLNGYFFITEHYIALRKGINRNANTYVIEEIEVLSDATLFTIRITLNKNFVDSEYSGPNYLFQFFRNDSAFYIEYDVYSLGYGDGFRDGRDYGRGIGYQEGYVKGSNEGYYRGYDAGLEDGYNQGYEDGYEVGELDGYDEGYSKGYNAGLEQSYDVGYNDGYDDGYQEGYDDGINTNYDYMQGYEDGFKAGEKSKIAQNSEAFYNNIEKWLVPAIITVIIVGGIVSIIAIKRRES